MGHVCVHVEHLLASFCFHWNTKFLRKTIHVLLLPFGWFYAICRQHYLINCQFDWIVLILIALVNIKLLKVNTDLYLFSHWLWFTACYLLFYSFLLRFCFCLLSFFFGRVVYCSNVHVGFPAYAFWHISLCNCQGNFVLRWLLHLRSLSSQKSCVLAAVFALRCVWCSIYS